MIFSKSQIGRFGISQREIGVSDREIFARLKYFILPSKIGISDTLRDKYSWFLGAIILLCKCPVEL